MKIFRLLATLGLVIAGILLLAHPSHATSIASAPFVPTRFTVVDAGTPGKPDVILIPGLASSRSVWDAEAKLLAPNYRLHLLQINGFAGQPAGANAAGNILPGVADELHQYIVAQRMHPAVIGHSMGGLLTLMLADKHPEDVRKIVIVDSLPFYALVFNPAATVDNTRPQAEAIKQQMLAIPNDQFAAMQPMMSAQFTQNPDGQKAVAASSIASDRAVFVEAMVEDLETDLRSDIASIKTPAIVLYAYDATAKQPDPAQYEALVKASYKPMPNATLVKVEDSRHFIMYDQPARLDAAIEPFLK